MTALCEKHKEPITKAQWNNGSRKKGCLACLQESCKKLHLKRSSQAVPPPEERLCVKHNRPILPSRWKFGGKNTGCAKCSNENARGPKARARRQKIWDSAFVACSKHPDRRSNRSAYVRINSRLCGSCHNRRADGSQRPALLEAMYQAGIRYRHSDHGKEHRLWEQRGRRITRRIEENRT